MKQKERTPYTLARKTGRENYHEGKINYQECECMNKCQQTDYNYEHTRIRRRRGKLRKS